MDAGKPDPQAMPPDSLSHRLSAALGGLRLPGGGWGTAAAFGGLIAAGPLLTLAGANMLVAHEGRVTLALKNQLAPRFEAEDTALAARTALANGQGRASPGEVLELLAGVLPPEASLTRIERTADGGLELDVTGGDPDALRAAIRRAPEFAGMRNTSQRRSDAAMIVSMREDAR
jgi:hypothetical protein